MKSGNTDANSFIFCGFGVYALIINQTILSFLFEREFFQTKGLMLIIGTFDEHSSLPPVELRSIMGHYLHFKAGVAFSSLDTITQ